MRIPVSGIDIDDCIKNSTSQTHNEHSYTTSMVSPTNFNRSCLKTESFALAWDEDRLDRADQHDLVNAQSFDLESTHHVLTIFPNFGEQLPFEEELSKPSQPQSLNPQGLVAF